MNSSRKSKRRCNDNNEENRSKYKAIMTRLRKYWSNKLGLKSRGKLCI